MRIGIVGGGYWGSKHLRVFEAQGPVDEISVIDPRVHVRDRLCRSFPRLRSYASLEEALPVLDAVVIATPPRTHAPLARRALEAGKHVLVEKPLATDIVDARELALLADQADLVLMVGHTFEYNAAVWWLRDAVASQELGDLYYIDTARLNLGLYQPDVNVVWDLAPHDISIINHVLGATPDSVQAWGRSYAHAYLEDVAHLRLEYSELGVSAQVHVSWLDPCKVRRVTLVGSSKMAVYNDLADDERIRVYDKGVEPSPHVDSPPAGYRYDGLVSPALRFDEPLAVEDRHFLECVADGARPQTDGWVGVAVVEVLAAAERSLREGRSIELEQVTTLSSPAVA